MKRTIVANEDFPNLGFRLLNENFYDEALNYYDRLKEIGQDAQELNRYNEEHRMNMRLV